MKQVTDENRVTLVSQRLDMRAIAQCVIALGLGLAIANTHAQSPGTSPPRNIALINGQWFTGSTFDRRAVYSMPPTLGVFDNLTLLKIWAETTPWTIFPDRQIGLLRDGYEATFLALGGNPLDDLTSVRRSRICRSRARMV